jgi:hypothetical protein
MLPNLRLILLRVHASWLNQIEISFSILHGQALTPNYFPDLTALAARIGGAESSYVCNVYCPWRRVRDVFQSI